MLKSRKFHNEKTYKFLTAPAYLSDEDGLQGGYGYSGDGGPAVEATLQPEFIAMDGTGNLYIFQHGRIRRVDSKGTFTTLAGTHPAHSLATDDAGNLYWASARVIYKMDTGGIITTFAGRSHHHDAMDRNYIVDGTPAVEAEFESVGVMIPLQSGRIGLHTSGRRVSKVSRRGDACLLKSLSRQNGRLAVRLFSRLFGKGIVFSNGLLLQQRSRIKC